jgi:T-complex protein 1 subunit alpha
LANIVKSSLGPVGLDKMLVDEVGDVTITNDGATILKQLEVEHPAAKVLVELSNLQDQEVGDGTTSVVILAAELLKMGDRLVKNSIHPTTVISGLLLAKKEACKFIRDHCAIKVEALGKDAIINSAKTSMSSKIIGAESEFFAAMAVEAVTRVKTTTAKGKAKYPVKAINILKAHGKSIKESELVDGFALNCVKAAQGMPTSLKKAKIAILDIDLRKAKMAFGVQVLVDDPSKLEDIRKKEADITKDRIAMLLKAGANVILTTKGIDDMAMKYFVENKVLAVRRCAKADLKHIAKATGGALCADILLCCCH